MSVNMCSVPALLFCFALLAGVRSLSITTLTVPKHANIDSSVTLECQFDLGRAKLYSVKWYKDDFEFFRYMPSDEKKISTFRVPGITLNIHKSGMDHVTLTELEYRSSGTFKCEVSTEAPDFNTSLDSKNMTVLAFPDRPPLITGVQERYTETEYILANCTSGRSNPEPKLFWYINGRVPDSWYVSESGPIEHEGPLYSRQVSLQYPASKISQDKEVSINCSAEVADMPPVVSKVITRIASALANQQLSQELLHNSGIATATTCMWPLLSVLYLLS